MLTRDGMNSGQLDVNSCLMLVKKSTSKRWDCRWLVAFPPGKHDMYLKAREVPRNRAWSHWDIDD